jgi:hypothetical protein
MIDMYLVTIDCLKDMIIPMICLILSIAFYRCR